MGGWHTIFNYSSTGFSLRSSFGGLPDYLRILSVYILQSELDKGYYFGYTPFRDGDNINRMRPRPRVGKGSQVCLLIISQF